MQIKRTKRTRTRRRRADATCNLRLRHPLLLFAHGPSDDGVASSSPFRPPHPPHLPPNGTKAGSPLWCLLLHHHHCPPLPPPFLFLVLLLHRASPTDMSRTLPSPASLPQGRIPCCTPYSSCCARPKNVARALLMVLVLVKRPCRGSDARGGSVR